MMVHLVILQTLDYMARMLENFFASSFVGFPYPFCYYYRLLICFDQRFRSLTVLESNCRFLSNHSLYSEATSGASFLE